MTREASLLRASRKGVVVTTRDEGVRHDANLEALAKLKPSFKTDGTVTAVMGLGPSAAVPMALERARLKMDDLDLFELNEAFAAQSLAVCRELGIAEEKVNVFGGAIALGHPIGASGARVLVTLAHALRSRQQTYGVASLCIGGGMGIAVVLRNGDAG